MRYGNAKSPRARVTLPCTFLSPITDDEICSLPHTKHSNWEFWCREMHDTRVKQFGGKSHFNNVCFLIPESWRHVLPLMKRNHQEYEKCENLYSCEMKSNGWVCEIGQKYVLQLLACENLAEEGDLSRSHGNWESQNDIELWTQIWGEFIAQSWSVEVTWIFGSKEFSQKSSLIFHLLPNEQQDRQEGVYLSIHLVIILHKLVGASFGAIWIWMQDLKVFPLDKFSPSSKLPLQQITCCQIAAPLCSRHSSTYHHQDSWFTLFPGVDPRRRRCLLLFTPDIWNSSHSYYVKHRWGGVHPTGSVLSDEVNLFG